MKFGRSSKKLPERSTMKYMSMGARRQFSKPEPVILSTPAGAMSIAVLASRLFTGPTGDAGAPILSRTRASHPAAWGAEADVPENGDPKPPTPLTTTRSAAAHVGPGEVVKPGPATPVHGPEAAAGQIVVEPSWTGPPLLNPSIAPALASPPVLASTAAAEVAKSV